VITHHCVLKRQMTNNELRIFHCFPSSENEKKFLSIKTSTSNSKIYKLFVLCPYLQAVYSFALTL
jgi:hypothetical protein